MRSNAGYKGGVDQTRQGTLSPGWLACSRDDDGSIAAVGGSAALLGCCQLCSGCSGGCGLPKRPLSRTWACCMTVKSAASLLARGLLRRRREEGGASGGVSERGGSAQLLSLAPRLSSPSIHPLSLSHAPHLAPPHLFGLRRLVHLGRRRLALALGRGLRRESGGRSSGVRKRAGSA